MTMRKVKVVLVGAAQTGKTSLVNRYVFNEFTPYTITTTQPAFSQVRINRMGKDINLEIWDTAGQEKYNGLSPLFYRDAEAGIVVFDITDASSFERAKQWIKELKNTRSDNIHITLAGTKIDLGDQRAVDSEMGKALAESISAAYFETSSLSGENVNSLFFSIADYIAQKAATEPSTGVTSSPKTLKGNIQFTEPKPARQCC